MIHYKRGGRWHFFNLFIIRGSLFPASFGVAGPCAALAFVLKWYEPWLVEALTFDEPGLRVDSAVWGGFSSLVGFLIVFRTSQAYSRFWDGCTATHQMRAEWIDAAAAIMSFCCFSKAPEEDIVKFKHLAVRLFSLLHAMALGEIEECEDFDGVMAFNLELIDPCGLDQQSWRTLKQCHNKVTLVFTWLQTVIVEHVSSGVLSIPPPILSRVFQELANGMVKLHEAQKISNIPFPFPYAQTCDVLLFIHWIVTPMVTMQWCSNPGLAAVFSFIQVFILWSLNNIAVEIEHPFGNDANDLDAAQMQLDMNMSLLLVLHPAATRAPHLSQQAQIDGLVRLGRAASQTVDDVSSKGVVSHFNKHTVSYNDVIGGAGDTFWEAANEVNSGTSPSRNSGGHSGLTSVADPNDEVDGQADGCGREALSDTEPMAPAETFNLQHMDPISTTPLPPARADVDPLTDAGSRSRSSKSSRRSSADRSDQAAVQNESNIEDGKDDGRTPEKGQAANGQSRWQSWQQLLEQGAGFKSSSASQANANVARPESAGSPSKSSRRGLADRAKRSQAL